MAKQPVKKQTPSSFPDLMIGAVLIAAIFIAYGQVAHFGFVNYDDDLYVYNNPHVQEGLTPSSIAWAWTAVVSSNWMPVTLLSHMLDAQLFGTDAGMHHLTNVFWHALASLLLFMTLLQATRSRWPSAFVALVFALHPLHVGSVAWVSERKDVLSAFFWFLALYWYVRYAEKPTGTRYLLVNGAFALGLMAKPMLVSFPLILLLFDLWPLNRIEWKKTLFEKLPLVTLAGCSSIIAYIVQQTTGAVRLIPLGTRIENALLSYVIYLWQTIWPFGLAAFYPYQDPIPIWEPVLAGVVVLGTTVLAAMAWRTRPYLTTGWFWFLITLGPVIGIVQVGDQAHADRYMYIPMVGLLIALAWSSTELVTGRQQAKAALVAVALGCMIITYNQTSYWQNSQTLFQHAIDVTGDTWLAQYNVGHYLMKNGHPAEAIPHFTAALKKKPGDVDTEDNLGFCLIGTGKAAEAIPYFQAVLNAKPQSLDAEYNLAQALVRTQGREAEAIPHFQAVLRGRPDSVDTNNDLGATLLNMGRPAEAVPYFEKALSLKPDLPATHFDLALALSQIPGRDLDARVHYEKALYLRPDYAEAQRNLGLLLLRRGSKLEAIPHLEEAQKLHPEPAIAQLLERLR